MTNNEVKTLIGGNRTFVRWGFIVGALSVLLTMPAPAHAEEVSGIEIVPSFSDVLLTDTDESWQQAIAVTNHTKQAATFTMSIADFPSTSQFIEQLFPGTSTSEPLSSQQFSLAAWVTLEKTLLALDPGETEQVTVRILKTASMPIGGHYGAVVLSTTAGDAAKQTQTHVSLNQQFLSLLAIRKVGESHGSIGLSTVQFDQPLFSVPTQASLTFTNDGNMHLIPRGRIDVIDPLGRLVATGKVNSDSLIVLPGSFRTYVNKLDTVSPSFIPGKYRVVIQYRHDLVESFTRYESTYYTFGKYIVILGVILLIVGGIVVRIRFRRPRHVVN